MLIALTKHEKSTSHTHISWKKKRLLSLAFIFVLFVKCFSSLWEADAQKWFWVSLLQLYHSCFPLSFPCPYSKPGLRSRKNLFYVWQCGSDKVIGSTNGKYDKPESPSERSKDWKSVYSHLAFGGPFGSLWVVLSPFFPSVQVKQHLRVFLQLQSRHPSHSTANERAGHEGEKERSIRRVSHLYG